jgi:hypothetical protein
VSQQVIHLDFISLSPDAGREDRNHLIDAAAQLADLPQVETLGVIEADEASGSDFDLVFYFQLPDFTALEPFGTNPRYASFLQGAVAPRLKAFAGADIRLDADFAAAGASGACFALMATEETYDWEVRVALQEWCSAASGDSSAVGLAVGERQIYRGVAFSFAPSLTPVQRPEVPLFRTTLVAGAARALA